MTEQGITLLERTSIEEQERQQRVRLPGHEVPVVFGFLHGAWRELVDSMEEGDELWTFTTSPESWKYLAGRSGIALVRQGEVVSTLVTVMN